MQKTVRVAVIGAGNTGMRMMGLKPTGARAMREYVRVIKALLRGAAAP